MGKLERVFEEAQQKHRGRTVAIISRFARSIRGHGTIMNATDVAPISLRYKLVFPNAAQLVATLCVLPGSATYSAALRAQEARTITAQPKVLSPLDLRRRQSRATQ